MWKIKADKNTLTIIINHLLFGLIEVSRIMNKSNSESWIEISTLEKKQKEEGRD